MIDQKKKKKGKPSTKSGRVGKEKETCNACRVKGSIRLWVAVFFSSRNIVAILLFHWESWLGFGMTINPGKRKTRRFALGKLTHCSKNQATNSS